MIHPFFIIRKIYNFILNRILKGLGLRLLGYLIFISIYLRIIVKLFLNIIKKKQQSLKLFDLINILQIEFNEYKNRIDEMGKAKYIRNFYKSLYKKWEKEHEFNLKKIQRIELYRKINNFIKIKLLNGKDNLNLDELKKISELNYKRRISILSLDTLDQRIKDYLINQKLNKN